MDEVLLARRNIFNRSRIFLTVKTVETLYPRFYGGKDKLNRIIKVTECPGSEFLLIFFFSVRLK